MYEKLVTPLYKVSSSADNPQKREILFNPDAISPWLPNCAYIPVTTAIAVASELYTFEPVSDVLGGLTSTSLEQDDIPAISSNINIIFILIILCSLNNFRLKAQLHPPRKNAQGRKGI